MTESYQVIEQFLQGPPGPPGNGGLVSIDVKTAAYVIAIGDMVPINATGGAVPLTAPAGATKDAVFGVLDLNRQFATSPTVITASAGDTIWDPRSETYAATATLGVSGIYYYRYLLATRQWVQA